MGPEITLPKSVRRAHPEWFEHPTVLGYPKGSRRQYRYGRLHIREYDDHITIHEDLFDPRTEPVDHVVHEAPELLAGAVCGIAAAAKTYRSVRDIAGSPAVAAVAGLLAGGAAFALGHYVTDRLRRE